MKYKITAYLLFSFLLSSHAFCQYDHTKLDELFEHSDFAGKDGYVVAVFKNDISIYTKSAQGFDLNKQVPIASASKWLAAAVIMRLADKKIISLDDRISKYIPSFNTTDKKNITIRQCFSHTSGLPGGQEAFDEFMGHRLKSYEKVVDEIAGVKMIAQPGTEFNYGGMGMQVAGRVAEIATGKNFHQLLKEEVTDPLDMKETHYPGYRLNIAPRVAGGILSTANDYLHFLQMISNDGFYKGRKYLSDESLLIMLSDQIKGASIGYSPYTKYAGNNTSSSYGIGNWVMNISGAVVNASPGAFGFTPWIDVKKKMYGVIAVRSSFQKVMPVFVSSLQILYSSK